MPIERNGRNSVCPISKQTKSQSPPIHVQKWKKKNLVNALTPPLHSHMNLRQPIRAQSHIRTQHQIRSRIWQIMMNGEGHYIQSKNQKVNAISVALRFQQHNNYWLISKNILIALLIVYKNITLISLTCFSKKRRYTSIMHVILC